MNLHFFYFSSPIKSDNPYADPVDFQTQYAVVQKSSSNSNLINNTDSSNNGNPSSPSETTNPQNSSSDEKTPGSAETSETIPKPPNVYGFILFMLKIANSFLFSYLYI